MEGKEQKLAMPEYGRNVLKMIEHLKEIPEKGKRSEQAAAVVKVMELLNPQVRSQESYKQRLWDQLYIISGFDLDIDSPYPCPIPEDLSAKPEPIPMKDIPIKATHYGRNIEKIINLLIDEPEGEIKTALIHALANYMRTQYLIWNKDSVADETIFSDIEKLSDGKLKVPEGLSLEKISGDINFSRPSLGIGQKSGKNRNRKNFKKKK